MGEQCAETECYPANPDSPARAQPLFEAGPTEGVFKIDIDVSALRAWRRKFPALADANLA